MVVYQGFLWQTARGVRVATTFLPDYLKLIDQLLEGGRFHEATQHCRHILKQHPRHIPTYRALAKALLEQHQYSDAADVFHRVLSADPNDFIAHVGLSLIHREEKRSAQALWHMERAFELEPYNNAIRQELQALYRKTQNQRKTDALQPNRKALAHLYFRSEMYGLAINELQAARSENGDGERIDLDVLLAEALWRDGQRVEAVSVCLRVLDKLPNCIPVNAILGEIWLLTGRVDEARAYLQSLQELTRISKQDFDPETAVGRAFRAAGAPLIPEHVEVTTMDTMGEEPSDVADVGADWVEDLAESDEDEIYSWLQDLADPVEESEEAEEIASPTALRSDWFQDEMPTATATVPEEDWLAELEGSSPLVEDGEKDPTSSALLDFSGLLDAEEEPGTGIQEMPEWLVASTEDDSDLSQLDVDSAVDWLSFDELADAQASDGGTDWFSDPTQERLDFETDWFVDKAKEAATAPDVAESLELPDEEDQKGETAVPAETPSTKADGQEIPAWLMTGPFGPPPADESSGEEIEEIDEEGVPHWLMTSPLDEIPPDLLSEPEGVPVEEALMGPSEEPEEEFDWLFAAEDEEEGHEETAVAGEADLSSEDALELTELSDSPGLVTSMLEGGQEELPDWLLSSDLGEPVMEEESEEDDAFIEELFGSLSGAVIDDTIRVSDSDRLPEMAEKVDVEQPTTPPEMLTEEGWAAGPIEDEEPESGELPAWLFGTSLGDSEDLTSPTGDIDLSRLGEEPALATSDLSGSDLPEWLSADVSETEAAEDDFISLPDFADEDAGVPDEDEILESFAAMGSAEEASLEEKGSSLLDWLTLEPTDSGEMEAVEMAEKDEMAQPVPEMPEDKPAPEEMEETSDWLQELANAPGPDKDAAAELEPAEMPDWIQDLSQTSPTADEAEPEVLFDALSEEEVSAEEAVTGATNMLDWLQDETAVSDETPPSEEPEDFDLGFEDEQEGKDTSTLWLDALATQQEAPEESEDEAPEVEEPYFADLDPEATILTDLPEEIEPAAAEADALSWLDEMASEPGDMLQAELDTLSAKDDALEWLSDLEAADIPSELPSAAEPEDDDEEWSRKELTSADAAAWLAELATDPGLPEGDAMEEETAAELAFEMDASEIEAEEALQLDDLLAELEPDSEGVDWSDEQEEAEDALMMDEFSAAEMGEELDDLTPEGEAEEVAEEWLSELEEGGEDTEEDLIDLDLLPEMEAEIQEDEGPSDLPEDEEAIEGLAELVYEDDEAAVAAEEALEDLPAPAESEIVPEVDSWLDGLIDEEEELDTEFTLGELLGDAEDEVDDWLEDVTEEPQVDALETVAEYEAQSEFVAEADLADFSLDDDSEEEDVAAWLDGLTDEAEIDLASLSAEREDMIAGLVDTADSDDLLEEDEGEDVLAWLGDLAAETVDELEIAEEEDSTIGEPEPEMAVDDAAEPDEEDELTWLGDLTEETAQKAEIVDEEATDITFPEDAMFPRDVGVPTDVPEELDDTMAWLAELAAEQGVSLEELELDGDEAPAEETFEEADIEEPAEVPSAEIDDAMAWLEHLAAEQGTPIEPLPTVADRALAEHLEEDELAAAEPDELETAVAAETDLTFPEDAMFPRDVGEPTDVPEEVDDAMEWLQDLMAEQGLEPELEDELVEVSIPEDIQPEAAAELEPVAEEEPDVTPEPVDEVALALDWLEEIAMVDAAKVEVDESISVVDPAATDLFAALDWVEQQLAEPPAAEELDLGIDVDEIPEDPEQALAWLAGMAEEDEEELPEEAVGMAEETETAVSPTLTPTEEDLVEEFPDDPDAAMAWLDQIAAEQEAMVVDEEVETAAPPKAPAAAGDETEIIFPEDAMFPRDVGVPTDVPEELDDTMDWLEDLMAEQGLSMDDLETDEETTETAVAAAPELLEEEAVIADAPALEEATVAEVDESLEDEQDADLDAMFATEAEAQVDEISAVDELEQVDTVQDEEPAESLLDAAEPAPEELLDLDDDSMEDTFDKEEEIQTGGLGWLDELVADEESGEIDLVATEEEEEDSGSDKPEMAQDVPEIPVELGTEYDINAELVESWPKWLNSDEEDQSGIGETGWLKSFGETDVSSWLTAEDEVMASGIFEDITLPQTGPLRSAAFDVGDVPDVDTNLLSEKPEPTFDSSIMTVDEEKLEAARKAIDIGDLPGAIQIFKELIESGRGLSIIIADLETAVQKNPKEAPVRRLLGDAYMRNGQLQKALDTYRQALDNM